MESDTFKLSFLYFFLVVGILIFPTSIFAKASVKDAVVKSPVVINESYQAVIYEDKKGDIKRKWYESEMAKNEGFAVLLKYTAQTFKVRVTEYIEMSGPADWGLQFYQECDVVNQGRQITCTRMMDNNGVYYSQWLLNPDDPVGPVLMRVTVGDAEPKEFEFSVIERINLFAN